MLPPPPKEPEGYRRPKGYLWRDKKGKYHPRIYIWDEKDIPPA